MHHTLPSCDSHFTAADTSPLLRRFRSPAMSPANSPPRIGQWCAKSQPRVACWPAPATLHRGRAPLCRRDPCVSISFLQGLGSKGRGHGCEYTKLSRDLCVVRFFISFVICLKTCKICGNSWKIRKL
jgi:hypothetical protein